MSFISGYSVAATSLGEPDLGLLTQTEIVEQARRVCNAVSIPILVDADTGYGNPLNVIRTVKLLIAIERAKTKYISHGVEMLKKTSREASVVRAVSAAEMAPMMATGMTRPPQLARNREPLGALGPSGLLCGIEVMVRIPERGFLGPNRRVNASQPK